MAEYLLCLEHAFDQRIDVAAIVVHVERRTSPGAYVEPPHQRLRAVVTRTNADPVAIEDGREVVRMHVTQRKAHDAAPRRRRRAVDRYAFDLHEPGGCVRH